MPLTASRTLSNPEADRLASQLDACNGYLARIGDPEVTSAIIDEVADVLSVPRKVVACFAKYGRLNGLVRRPTRTFASPGAIPLSHGRFFSDRLGAA